MKNIILAGVMGIGITGFAQIKEEVIIKEYAFEQNNKANVFQLSNVNGFIKVEVHDQDNYILEARKKITAKTSERLELGMKEIGVSVLDRYDTIIVYASSPCQTFNKHKQGKRQGYGYAYNDCEFKYDFKIDMTLKVPRNANLILRTVNEGDIEVNGVLGSINVRNINGAIFMDNVAGQIIAHTINGDVDVNYSKNPRADSRYYTLNGDINANFKVGLAAKISFKSFNGEMYTNLPSLKTLPGEIKKERVKDSDGIKFKIDEHRVVQTRDGDVMLDFETFNGDAIIKEK
jgi:DUF4097 and DUF4098 domain-containing protein YvlB